MVSAPKGDLPPLVALPELVGDLVQLGLEVADLLDGRVHACGQLLPLLLFMLLEGGNVFGLGTDQARDPVSPIVQSGHRALNERGNGLYRNSMISVPPWLGTRTTTPPQRAVRTNLNSRNERANHLTLPSARPRARPRVTTHMRQPELLHRWAKLAARMHRDDVIDARRTSRPRRLEVDRLTTQLATIIRPSAQLRQHPRNMHTPKVTVSPTRPGSPRHSEALHRHQRETKPIPQTPSASA